MFRTILWATDGSPSAERALPVAKALAHGPDAKLLAIHVREMIVGRGGGYPILADDDEIVAEIQRRIEELRAEGFDATLDVGSAVTSGAAEVIADFARDAEADVIVVGTRGHGPVAGLLVGSVTQRLLHLAPCPVLSVPTGKHAELREPETAGAAAR